MAKLQPAKEDALLDVALHDVKDSLFLMLWYGSK